MNDDWADDQVDLSKLIEPPIDFASIKPVESIASTEPPIDLGSITPADSMASTEPPIDFASITPTDSTASTEPPIDFALTEPPIDFASFKPIKPVESMASTEPVVVHDVISYRYDSTDAVMKRSQEYQNLDTHIRQVLQKARAFDELRDALEDLFRTLTFVGEDGAVRVPSYIMRRIKRILDDGRGITLH